MNENYRRATSRQISLCLIILLSLFSLSKSSCKIGCLSCQTIESQHRCHLCDSSLYYHMVGVTRNLYSMGFGLFSRKLENEIVSTAGECEFFPQCLEVYGRNCAKCEPGYVIVDGADDDNGLPLKVCQAVSNVVDHCKEYLIDGICSKCVSGYFLHNEVENLKKIPQNEKQCLVWPKQILKCREHFKDPRNNIKCLECEPGFMLSQKLDKCEEHQDQNCLIASNIGCQKCSAGYSLYEEPLNYVPGHIQDFSFGDTVLKSMLSNIKRTDLIHCQPQIEFCRKYITIRSFSKDKLVEQQLKMNTIDFLTKDKDEDIDRKLNLLATSGKKMFEVKFGEDEMNKWVFGISKSNREKNLNENNIEDDLKNEKLEIKDIGNENLSNMSLQNDDFETVTCGRCAPGYYLYQVEPLKFECFEAELIDNCEFYKDHDTCFLCEQNFFLHENECKSIDKTNFVEHCEYYDQNQECLKCNSSFALFHLKENKSQKIDHLEFEKTHPYMKNLNMDNQPESIKNKPKKDVIGKDLEVGDNLYQMIKQMSVTEMISRETLTRFGKDQISIEDLESGKENQKGLSKVNYDLSSLDLDFNNAAASTVIYEPKTKEEEDIVKRNEEIAVNVAKAKNKHDKDEDTSQKIDVDREKVTVGKQVVEKQVIKETGNEEVIDSEDITEGVHFNESEASILKHEEQTPSNQMNNNTTEEDIVVLNEPSHKSTSSPHSRNLMDLFSIFKHAKKPRRHTVLNATTANWSLRLHSKLRGSLGKGRILTNNQSEINDSVSDMITQTNDSMTDMITQSSSARTHDFDDSQSQISHVETITLHEKSNNTEQSQANPEHDNLKKFHDSKNIIMDTSEDVHKQEIAKDKEFLDRLFESEGKSVDDLDQITDKEEKRKMIHNIINKLSNLDLGGSLVENDIMNPLSHKESPSLDDNISKELNKSPQSQPDVSPVKRVKAKTPTPESQKPNKGMCMILNTIPNCQSHYHGICTQCDKSFYLVGEICKSLSSEKLVQFCENYDRDQNCITCKAGFVLVSTKCIKLKEVQNCNQQIYYPNGQCLLCKHGHVYDQEDGRCVSRETSYFNDQQAKENPQDLKIEKNDDEIGDETIDFDRNCLLERSNADRSCYMCRREYYMNKKGECIFGKTGITTGFWKLF